MIVVDSSVWIDYLRGTMTPQADKLDALIGSVPIAIGDLILTEVLQGIANDREFQQTRQMLERLNVVEIGGREVAIKAAENFRALRALGVTVRKTVDTLIATRCIEDGHSLLFSDRDFEPFVAHLGLVSAYP